MFVIDDISPIKMLRLQHSLYNEYLGHYPKEVTADSGYSSEKNFMFLRKHEIDSYIKLQSHENIQSERAIYYRQIRSIQTEDFFGDIKDD
jgi:hypothetical protein